MFPLYSQKLSKKSCRQKLLIKLIEIKTIYLINKRRVEYEPGADD